MTSLVATFRATNRYVVAVPDVAVGALLARRESDRQDGLCPVECLDLRLLIGREHHRTVRRLQVLDPLQVFANPRVNQCDCSLPSGSVMRISAVTRARARAGTRSRVPAVHQLPQLSSLFGRKLHTGRARNPGIRKH